MDIMAKWLLQPVLLKKYPLYFNWLFRKCEPTAVGHESSSILSPCWRTLEQTVFLSYSSSLFLPWEVKVHAGGFDLWQTNLLNQTFRFSNISYQLCLWLTGAFVFFLHVVLPFTLVELWQVCIEGGFSAESSFLICASLPHDRPCEGWSPAGNPLTCGQRRRMHCYVGWGTILSYTRE